jgi:hypothetical protein
MTRQLGPAQLDKQIQKCRISIFAESEQSLIDGLSVFTGRTEDAPMRPNCLVKSILS